jgi:hypothetical protein
MEIERVFKAFLVVAVSFFITSLIGGFFVGLASVQIEATENNIRLLHSILMAVTLFAGLLAGLTVHFVKVNKEQAFVGAAAAVLANTLLTLSFFPPNLWYSRTIFFQNVTEVALSHFVQTMFAIQVVGGTFLTACAAYFVVDTQQANFWGQHSRNNLLVIIGAVIGAATMPAFLKYAIHQPRVDPTMEAIFLFGLIGLAIGLFLALRAETPFDLPQALGLSFLSGVVGAVGGGAGFVAGAAIGLAVALTYRRSIGGFLFLPALMGGAGYFLVQSATEPSTALGLAFLYAAGAGLGVTIGVLASFQVSSEPILSYQPDSGTTIGQTEMGAQLLIAAQESTANFTQQVHHSKERALFETNKLRQIRAKQGEIRNQQQQKEQRLTRLGLDAYRLYQENKLNSEDLRDTFTLISRQQTEIVDCQKELEAIKTAVYQETEEETSATEMPGFCPRCGQPLLPEYRFCQACGELVDTTNSLDKLLATGQSVAKTVWAKARSGASKAAFTADKMRRQRVVQSQLENLNRALTTQLTQAGGQVYHQHQSGEVVQSSLQPLCQEITSLDAVIKTKEAELADIRASTYQEADEDMPSPVMYQPVTTTATAAVSFQPQTACPICDTLIPAGTMACPTCAFQISASQDTDKTQSCPLCSESMAADTTTCPNCAFYLPA